MHQNGSLYKMANENNPIVRAWLDKHYFNNKAMPSYSRDPYVVLALNSLLENYAAYVRFNDSYYAEGIVFQTEAGWCQFLLENGG